MLAVNATLFPLARSYSSLVVYVVVFGLFDGCLAVMFGMGTLHIVGEKLVGRAFGNLCCAAAVGNLLGPPVAGWYILSNVRLSRRIVLCDVTASSALNKETWPLRK